MFNIPIIRTIRRLLYTNNLEKFHKIITTSLVNKCKEISNFCLVMCSIIPLRFSFSKFRLFT